MRLWIALAFLATLFATPASAGDWCAYSSNNKSLVECGYSSADHCQSAIDKQKDGLCFPDPDFA